MEIYIEKDGEYTNITNLDRAAYENFLDAMLRLTLLYMQRIREEEGE